MVDCVVRSVVKPRIGLDQLEIKLSTRSYLGNDRLSAHLPDSMIDTHRIGSYCPGPVMCISVLQLP